ncbi:MAG: SRPBCC family protein [Gemmatimonadaceae bacterium]
MHRAMVDVSTQIVINRPRQRVAQYTAIPDNAPHWYVNIKSVKWQTPRPLRVGSRIAFVAEFLGRTLSYTYEIVEHIPGEKLIMSASDGPFPMETTYLWKSAGDGRTEMTLRNRGAPSGFSRFLAPILAVVMRRTNNKDLKLLKQILERGGYA